MLILAWRRLLTLTIAIYLSLMLINPVQASVVIDAQFEASSACEAFESIRNRTNPGNIRLIPGNTYSVTAKNKPNETHYYLMIEDVEPQQRWVDVSCGELQGRLSDDDQAQPFSSSENLLAISWQPAFCETHQNKTECETQTTGRFDASNFTLHGLWPQPRSNSYCNVNDEIQTLDRERKWSQLPPIRLSESLLQELTQKMPGVASNLHLHEWYKHGTCYSETPEEYYQESLALLAQVNNSEVRELFVTNLGTEVNGDDILAEFETAFGNDAKDKVAISCATDNQPTKRRMIVELKLNLKGEIESDTTMTKLLTTGQTVNSRDVCPAGEIDPAGFS